MSDSGHSPPVGREFVLRTIHLVMLVDMAVGGALVLLGLFVFDNSALAIAGAFLACMGAALVIVFRALKRRADSSARAGRISPHELRR